MKIDYGGQEKEHGLLKYRREMKREREGERKRERGREGEVESERGREREREGDI